MQAIRLYSESWLTERRRQINVSKQPSCWGLDIRFFYGIRDGGNRGNKAKDHVILTNISWNGTPQAGEWVQFLPPAIYRWRVMSKGTLFFYFTILYWFCHTSAWICHGYTRVPHPEPPSHLPPRTMPLGHPGAPAPGILYHATNLDWRFISHMILYMFQCHSPKTSHPHPLPQSPKDCSIHLCLFCCLAYRVIVTIFLNSIYMH